jgi:hypothetical protein
MDMEKKYPHLYGFMYEISSSIPVFLCGPIISLISKKTEQLISLRFYYIGVRTMDRI